MSGSADYTIVVDFKTMTVRDTRGFLCKITNLFDEDGDDLDLTDHSDAHSLVAECPCGDFTSINLMHDEVIIMQDIDSVN